jgi:hypothetical protein
LWHNTYALLHAKAKKYVRTLLIIKSSSPTLLLSYPSQQTSTTKEVMLGAPVQMESCVIRDGDMEEGRLNMGLYLLIA